MISPYPDNVNFPNVCVIEKFPSSIFINPGKYSVFTDAEKYPLFQSKGNCFNSLLILSRFKNVEDAVSCLNLFADGREKFSIELSCLLLYVNLELNIPSLSLLLIFRESCQSVCADRQKEHRMPINIVAVFFIFTVGF